MDKRADDLRSMAKEKLAKRGWIDDTQWGDDIKKVVEELSIYQIELEHQNKELGITSDKLYKTKEKYLDLFENAPLAYFIVDKNQNIVNINNTAAKMFKFDTQNIVGKRFTKLIHPEFQDTYYHFFRFLNKTETGGNCDLKVRRADDYFFYVTVTGTKEAGGEPDEDPEFRLALLDITGKKEMEMKVLEESEKLRKSEAKFRQIVERAYDIFLYQDIKTKHFTYISPKLFDFLGYRPEEVKEKTIRQLADWLPEEYRDVLIFMEQILNAAEQKGRESVERIFPVRAKNGEYRWFEGNFCFVRNDAGEPHQIMGSLHDITRRKNAEDEMLKAKHQAEESDRLKSVFLANMSHEIRTPLNGVLGFAELLKREGLSEEKRRMYLNIISAGGHTLLELINSLIDISKIESGRFEIIKRKVDILELLNQLHEFFKPEAEDRELDFVLQNEVPYMKLIIETDAPKLKRILTNLIKNALKYTPKGSISFGVGLGSDKLKFYVKDTGPGIPKKKQKTIFERFSQAEDTDPSEGAGLGLNIAKGLTEILGGEIGFNSKEGIGTEFRVSIPYDSIEKVEHRSAVFAPDETPKLGGKSIFLAEDDNHSYVYIREILHDTNAKLTRFEDADQLRLALEKGIPDIIFLDINLPVADGFEVVAEIKGRYPDLPVIAQTAFDPEENIEKYTQAGFDDFLSKPFGRKEFYYLLNRYLK